MTIANAKAAVIAMNGSTVKGIIILVGAISATIVIIVEVGAIANNVEIAEYVMM